MKWWHIVLMVGGMCVIDFVVVGAVLHFAVQSVLEPLSRAFPARPKETDAVRRQFQSMSMDAMNFGMCVHMTADAEHLHLEPAWLLRASGAKPSSVPWGAIAVVKKGRLGWKVKIEGGGKGEYGVPGWVGELVGRDSGASLSGGRE